MTLRFQLSTRVGRLTLDVALETGPRTLVVVGPNGAGKTTLLSLLLGARTPESGRIEVGSEVLLDTAASIDRPTERRRLGYVPQDYALFPHMTVAENVAFAVECSGTTKRRDALAARLSDLGLESLRERYPHALSGGERQRVALARALAGEPRALLLDEPLSALDVHSRHEVRGFLAAYLEKLALPAIVVTHDANDARALGHRIAVLERGSIVQTGTWDEIVAKPASPFVETLLASASG